MKNNSFELLRVAKATLGKMRRTVSVGESEFAALTNRLQSVQASQEARVGEPRVLLVSSNGAGLGHLSRLLGIANQLSGPTLIYTLSSAYHKTGLSKEEIVYFPSYGDLGMSGASWNPLLRAHFGAVVKGFCPDVIVFDGTYVYRGVTEVARNHRVPLVWIQRGCWKDEVRRASRQVAEPEKFVDFVVIPEDVAIDEDFRVQGQLQPRRVNPLTVITPSHLKSREEARQELGLPEGGKLFLIQVGAGVINEVAETRLIAVEAVKQLGPDWEPVVVNNPLKSSHFNGDVFTIHAFPLASYLRAFDAAVFAAGYNSVQESVLATLPAVFVPNPETKTDDQEKRALGMDERRLGIFASTVDQLRAGIISLGDDGLRSELTKRIERSHFEPGAPQVAQLLSEFAR